MIIEGDRGLSIELINEGHCSSLYELVNNNRAFFSPWLPWVTYADSEQFILKYIEGSKQRNFNGNEFAFVIMLDKKLIGRVGVYKIDGQNKIGEIGYFVDEEFSQKGHVKRACKLLMEFCFNQLKLNRLEIKCASDNLSSQFIPKSLNFKKEGVLTQAEWFNDHFKDLELYALIKKDML